MGIPWSRGSQERARDPGQGTHDQYGGTWRTPTTIHRGDHHRPCPLLATTRTNVRRAATATAASSSHVCTDYYAHVCPFKPTPRVFHRTLADLSLKATQRSGGNDLTRRDCRWGSLLRNSPFFDVMSPGFLIRRSAFTTVFREEYFYWDRFIPRNGHLLSEKEPASSIRIVVFDD